MKLKEIKKIKQKIKKKRKLETAQKSRWKGRNKRRDGKKVREKKNNFWKREVITTENERMKYRK